MTNNNLNKSIGIVSTPISKSGLTPVSNLVDLMKSLTNKIYLISGNEGCNFFKHDETIKLFGVNHVKGGNFLSRIVKYIILQIKITYLFLYASRNVDMWFFSIGSDSLLLPILISKLINKKVILIFAGSTTKTLKFSNDDFYKIFHIISKISSHLSYKIIVYSKNLIYDLKLEHFISKIIIAPRHFINFNHFKIIKPYESRKNIVGYIGRFNSEKGIINLLKSIAIIAKKKDINFLFIGQGNLYSTIENFSIKFGFKDTIKIIDWVPHEKLPKYLNQLKLIVLPSYSEGVPNIILESMACGVPVLASRVGGIPDIIVDKKTGFLLDDNSPESIAKQLIFLSDCNNMIEVVKNSREYVMKNFSYDAAIMKYRKVLNDI